MIWYGVCSPYKGCYLLRRKEGTLGTRICPVQQKVESGARCVSGSRVETELSVEVTEIPMNLNANYPMCLGDYSDVELSGCWMWYSVVSLPWLWTYRDLDNPNPNYLRYYLPEKYLTVVCKPFSVRTVPYMPVVDFTTFHCALRVEHHHE